MIYPADQAGLDAELQRHLAGQTPVFNTVYRMKHQDGHLVWIETYGKVVERDNQQQPVAIGESADRTRRRNEVAFLEGFSSAAANAAPLALRGALDCINIGGECGIEEGLEYEAAQFGLMFSTQDMREGTTAFLERRKPAFRGE